MSSQGGLPPGVEVTVGCRIPDGRMQIATCEGGAPVHRSRSQPASVSHDDGIALERCQILSKNGRTLEK